MDIGVKGNLSWHGLWPFEGSYEFLESSLLNNIDLSVDDPWLHLNDRFEYKQDIFISGV